MIHFVWMHKMKDHRRVSLRKIISNINLSEAEDILQNSYKYLPGNPGRPPLSPTGMFLSFILMLLRMESYRDYHAFLEKDQFWRRQLNFKKPPDIGSFTNFLKRIGIKTFEQIFASVVQQLLDKEFLNIHMVAQDGSILESNQDDPDAKWGWDHIEETNVYGYKIHVAVDPNTELPVALTITTANVHDSTQFQPIYNTVKSYHTRFPTKYFIGDKAYDSTNIRTPLLKDQVTPIIKASKTRIKPRYPFWFKKVYKKRTAVERFFSRLKEFLDLKKLKIYGKETVQLYSYLICIGMLLVGYINHQIGHSPRSIKTFLRIYT
jgi:transposase, IS5 family